MIEEILLSEFKGKKVLVTGGTGLIGRQVVALLVAAGADITVVSLDAYRVTDKAKHIVGDLAEFSFCREITHGMDYVFHLAGIKGSIKIVIEKPASVIVPILMMNTNILEASMRNNVKKLVYTSTIGAYASAEVFKESDYRLDSIPMEVTSWSKRMAEIQIQAYKKQFGLQYYSIVRPSNIYGPGDNFDPANAMVIPSLLKRIYDKEDPVIIWGDGTAVRDFLFSRDAAEGILRALHFGTKNNDFLNLGCGKGYSVKELVETLHSFLQFNYRFDPSKPSGFPKRVMDISRAQEVIGFNPSTSLLQGLKETWEWYVKNHEEYMQRKNYFKE